MYLIRTGKCWDSDVATSSVVVVALIQVLPNPAKDTFIYSQ